MKIGNSRICQDKEQKSKRISPYLESEIWEKDQLLYVIKYEP